MENGISYIVYHSAAAGGVKNRLGGFLMAVISQNAIKHRFFVPFGWNQQRIPAHRGSIFEKTKPICQTLNWRKLLFERKL
jgi:hypothetical protein